MDSAEAPPAYGRAWLVVETPDGTRVGCEIPDASVGMRVDVEDEPFHRNAYPHRIPRRATTTTWTITTERTWTMYTPAPGATPRTTPQITPPTKEIES